MSGIYKFILPLLIFNFLVLSVYLNPKVKIFSNLNKQVKNPIFEELNKGWSLPSQSIDYKTYCNSRFEFCIDYPTTLKPQGESANGDGQSFKSEDGLVALSAWGNLMVLTMKEELDIAMEEKQITYKVVKADWFVISGYTKEGNIFYRKTKTNIENGSFISFMLEYSVSQKDTYNKVCEKISNSFK